ncbi:hypothetical protein [Siphonobacter sp. BAB-5405]|nr:hypothetical protein [Siphonobacter sp. BAB-5405]
MFLFLRRLFPLVFILRERKRQARARRKKHQMGNRPANPGHYPWGDQFHP